MHVKLTCSVVKFLLNKWWCSTVCIIVGVMLLPWCVSYGCTMPAMLVIALFFSATCRRGFRHSRWRTLPSHRRLWPGHCLSRQANFQNSTQMSYIFTFFISCIIIHVLLQLGWDYCSCIRWTTIHPVSFSDSIDNSIVTLSHALVVLRQCLMKRPRPTLRVRLRETGCHA